MKRLFMKRPTLVASLMFALMMVMFAGTSFAQAATPGPQGLTAQAVRKAALRSAQVNPPNCGSSPRLYVSPCPSTIYNDGAIDLDVLARGLLPGHTYDLYLDTLYTGCGGHNGGVLNYSYVNENTGATVTGAYAYGGIAIVTPPYRLDVHITTTTAAQCIPNTYILLLQDEARPYTTYVASAILAS